VCLLTEDGCPEEIAERRTCLTLDDLTILKRPTDDSKLNKSQISDGRRAVDGD
jgi:hypothetical protein